MALQQFLNLLDERLLVALSSSFTAIPNQSSLRLNINAQICGASDNRGSVPLSQGREIHLGSIDISQSELQEYGRNRRTGQHTLATNERGEHLENHPSDTSQNEGSINLDFDPLQSNTAVSSCGNRNEDSTSDIVSENHGRKRRKTTGGLRVTQIGTSGSEIPSIRRLQLGSREFPQRKRKIEDGIHQLQPSSIERLVAGVWKQIYSSVELTTDISIDESIFNSLGGTFNNESFLSINTLCHQISKTTKCSRALETIVQAHWVTCFDARVKAIGIEKPRISHTECKMVALREACAVLKWSEKELRNRLAVWRGYHTLQEHGGWTPLVFASAGIYRFCKYRLNFNTSLFTTLQKLRSSFEVAADTLHPTWRKLLETIGQKTDRAYIGHPHDWVVAENKSPIGLRDTYSHLPGKGFEFEHIEESVLDEREWGTDDPRKVSAASSTFCLSCGYFQSDNVAINECRCLPELFGAVKAPVPVQVFQTPVGKNNGLVARGDFARGTAIGEFIGLITKGMHSTDVMQGGTGSNAYQIYQGKLGNYTRFINHSCAPNSQFQKFIWRGCERIIIVSKGIAAGDEITVDYSHEYWKGLDKECLCGAGCCRYVRRRSG